MSRAGRARTPSDRAIWCRGVRLGLMMGLAACSGDSSSHDDTSVADVEPDVTDTAPDIVGAVCPPHTATRARGVVATCRGDGEGWTYSACPAGRVCEVDGCVDNAPNVVLVAMPPLDDQGMVYLRAIPSELEAVVATTLCDEVPGCCDSFCAALARPGNASAQIATKYWLRRLLQDLRARGTFAVSLLGAPSRLNAVNPMCQPPTSVDACLEGAPDLMRYAEWRAMDLHTKPAVTSEQARVLLEASVRVTDGDPEGLLSWVDGVLTQDASGQVTNPELNTRQAGPYDMGLITWLYLTTDHRPEGRQCAADAECGHRHYRCVDGRCSDPAAACRTQDVVVLGTFLDQLQFGGPRAMDCYTGGVGGVVWDLWTRWLRWGISCKTQRDCRAGSSCMNPCDFSDYRPCSRPPACMPDDLFDYLGHDILLGSALADFNWWAPTPVALDSAGRELTVTFHSIFTGMAAGDVLTTVGAMEYATSAALLGGGIAVTPGVPELNPYFDDMPLASSDYEARYAELLEALSARRETTVCTPELVGLGGG